MVKTNILKSIAAVITGSLILIACKKNDNPVPDRASKLMFNWKIKSIATPKVGQPETDSALFRACMTDDIISFSATGFDFQDGTTKCDSTVFFYSKGTWAYKAATDSIQLSSTTPAKYLAWKIVTLNDTLLQVKFTDSIRAGIKINKTISFKH